MDSVNRKAIDEFMAKYPKLKEISSDTKKLEQFMASNEEISREFMQKLVHASNPEIALLEEIDSLASNSFVMALLKCQQGVTHFPEKRHLFYRKMAQLFEDEQNYKEAITNTEKAIKTTPKSLSDYEERIFWLKLSLCGYQVKLDEITKAYSIISELSTPSPDLSYHMDITKADILFRLEIYQFALLVIDGAIRKINPKDFKDYGNLYNLYSLKLRIDKKLNKSDACMKDEEKIAEYSFLMLPF